MNARYTIIFSIFVSWLTVINGSPVGVLLENTHRKQIAVSGIVKGSKNDRVAALIKPVPFSISTDDTVRVGTMNTGDSFILYTTRYRKSYLLITKVTDYGFQRKDGDITLDANKLIKRAKREKSKVLTYKRIRGEETREADFVIRILKDN